MKKILLTLLVAILATGAFAQLSGGIKAGTNFGTLKYDVGSASETYGGFGYHIGGYVNYALNDNMSLQPELLYSTTTYVVDLFASDPAMTYLSIPVMFKYGFADNKFNVHAGPQIGLLLSTDPSEAKDDMKGTDFSFAIGSQVHFGKFNLTARYILGLSNNSDIDGLDSKANAFQVSAGFRLFGE